MEMLINEINNYMRNFRGPEASKLNTAITNIITMLSSQNEVFPNENVNKRKSNNSKAVVNIGNFQGEFSNSFNSNENENFLEVRQYNEISRKKSEAQKKSSPTLIKQQQEPLEKSKKQAQKYDTIRKLFNLKQTRLGKAAEYTIEFRRLARLLGWPDNVLIDILEKGLLDPVREAFYLQATPKTLFEATNTVIQIDKKCYWESRWRKLNHKRYQHHHHYPKDTNNKKIMRNKKRKNFEIKRRNNNLPLE